jgi:alginate O-acetyltransferase complex protein AlgI
MRFDSLYFLLFFAVVFGLSRLRSIGPALYIIAGFAFYIVAGWQDFLVFAGMAVLNYLAALVVYKNKSILPLVLLLNTLPLLYFKYSGFLSGAFLAQSIFDTEILIPLGISFYTFQMIAYQVDLARGHYEPIRSFPRFYLFVSFFPQLVSGPIVRAKDTAPQIGKLFDRGPRKNLIYALGLGLCLLGLIKKIVLADSLAPFVNTAFSQMPTTMAQAWEGILIFGFQLYYDFSGYSDIVLGLAYLLGVRLPINFRQPYLAQSPSEFWRRWHITLSTWVRDYIYIPLGGNTLKGLAQLFALLFVMGLMGLWHGANWTFVAWGLGWGAAIVFWRYTETYMRKIAGLSWVLTMLVVFTLWVFFRAPDIDYALGYIRTMFSFDMNGYVFSAWLWVGILILVSLHRLESLFYNIKGIRFAKNYNSIIVCGLLAGLCLFLLILPKALNNPFIYFRF